MAIPTWWGFVMGEPVIIFQAYNILDVQKNP
jgi:hypothetical protein